MEDHQKYEDFIPIARWCGIAYIAVDCFLKPLFSEFHIGSALVLLLYNLLLHLVLGLGLRKIALNAHAGLEVRMKDFLWWTARNRIGRSLLGGCAVSIVWSLPNIANGLFHGAWNGTAMLAYYALAFLATETYAVCYALHPDSSTGISMFTRLMHMQKHCLLKLLAHLGKYILAYFCAFMVGIFIFVHNYRGALYDAEVILGVARFLYYAFIFIFGPGFFYRENSLIANALSE